MGNHTYPPFVADEHMLDMDHPNTVVLGMFQGYDTTAAGELRGMLYMLEEEFSGIVVAYDSDGDALLLGPEGDSRLTARCDELYEQIESGDGSFDDFYREAEDEAIESWWDSAEIDDRIQVCRRAGASLALALLDMPPLELDDELRNSVCSW